MCALINVPLVLGPAYLCCRDSRIDFSCIWLQLTCTILFQFKFLFSFISFHISIFWFCMHYYCDPLVLGSAYLCCSDSCIDFTCIWLQQTCTIFTHLIFLFSFISFHISVLCAFVRFILLYFNLGHCDFNLNSILYMITHVQYCGVINIWNKHLSFNCCFVSESPLVWKSKPGLY